MTTIRELLSDAWPDIESILDISEDERVRLACFRIEQRFIDALAELDASAPQCLDDPPGVSHRLVPDPSS